MNAVRTCLGCRVRAERQALLRVVCTGGEVVADPSATFPGRGAWVHPTAECIEASIKRKTFGRAFRLSVSIHTAGLLAYQKNAQEPTHSAEANADAGVRSMQQVEPQSRFLDEQAD